MVSLREYHSLSDFDQKRRRALESLLYSDEEFLYGIDIYDAILFTDRRASKLVLTDQRVIKFKRGFIKENSKDFSLDNISSIEHKKGYVMRKITVKGSGISTDYQTLEGFGKKFVTMVREQKNRNDQGREPVSPSPSEASQDAASSEEATEPAASSEEVPSKYGTMKNHLIVAVLTVWWTFGVGNLVYAGYSYYNFEN